MEILTFAILRNCWMRACRLERAARSRQEEFRNVGLVNQHALVNERYADYMAERGDTNEAEYRYKNAISLYEEWGAKAKVKLVQEKLGLLETE